MDGDDEMAVSETPEYPKAVDVEPSQQLSQPNTVNDESLVSKLACQKFVQEGIKSPRKDRVEIPKMMEQQQKKTPDPCSSQVTTVMETSSDRPNSSPDKVSSSLTQLPQTNSIVEEVPLCTPLPQ